MIDQEFVQVKSFQTPGTDSQENSNSTLSFSTINENTPYNYYLKLAESNI